MTSDPVTRAWLTLLTLSAATVLATLLIALPAAQSAVGAVVLLLSVLKARIILSRYLGLWQAPTWLSGFGWVLAFYFLLLLGLYLLPAFRS